MNTTKLFLESGYLQLKLYNVMVFYCRICNCFISADIISSTAINKRKIFVEGYKFYIQISMFV